MGVPIEVSKKDKECHPNVDTVAMIRVSRGDLLPDAQRLLVRLHEELKRHGAKPTKDRLPCMVCNPFAVAVLFEDLECMCKSLRDDPDVSADSKSHCLDFRREARKLLDAQIRATCHRILARKQGTGAPATA